ncbi:type VII secretion-associated serine protease mycosin [Micromonospora musae]|uniref:Type VII secretion-associated serine protease mycosin n=1 Tax=Micromonospora musae TaxID=1894970 RepID=A0ABX9RKC2_9ACTN|nr:type VII secretion-associated serine protease mycosin [Micromonospora musae]
MWIVALLATSATAPCSSAYSATTLNRVEPIQEGVDQIRDDQWHLQFLNIAGAHRLSLGEDVLVAVPDTGVDQHPDLRNNLLPGIDIIPGGSGDGRSDRDSHGTSMAGLVAAHGRGENQGALGIAPRAKIVPIFDSPPHGEGDSTALAQAIDFAVERGVDVISISSSGNATPQLERAVRTAMAADIAIVAAAGNKPGDRRVAYPASEEGVIAVGGITRSGTYSELSVSGPEIDLVAPAVDIYSTSYGGKYSKGTGTSGATAIVAGAVALIRSKYPYLPAREVVHRLTATAIDKGPPGRDDEYGYGVIDIVAALTADVPPLGFGSATASAPAGGGPRTTAAAEPPGDGLGSDNAATVRGLATLGVIVAAAVTWAVIVRRRRRGDDPPPRISR